MFDPDAPAEDDESADDESDDVRHHHHEDALEPVHLIRRGDAVLRVGLMMLGAGATSRRVLEAMRHMAAALDLDDMVAQVTTTTIVLTVHRRGIHRTQVGTVARHQIDADRLGATQHMASTLPPHLAVAEANRLMDAVESRPPLYPHAWQIPVAAGLGSLAFLFLNNGSPWEGPAVFIAGALVFAIAVQAALNFTSHIEL